jgi:hypothetical protein
MKMNNTTIYFLRGIPFALYFIAMIAAIIVSQSGTPLWALFLIDWVTEGSKNIFPINKIKAEPENPPPRPTAPQEPNI